MNGICRPNLNGCGGAPTIVTKERYDRYEGILEDGIAALMAKFLV